jgi:hypothetical protein
MKKNRGDEPVGVIIHVYTEISQGNSLCSYLYLKQPKMYFFSVLFFLLQNRRAGGWNRSCPGRKVGTSGMGEVAGKGERRVNMVHMSCK